jgi:hypothetical protein
VGWRPRPRLELELGVGGIALKGVAPEPLAVGAPLGLIGVLCCGGNIGDALTRVLAGLPDAGLDAFDMIYKLGCLINHRRRDKVLKLGMFLA